MLYEVLKLLVAILLRNKDKLTKLCFICDKLIKHCKVSWGSKGSPLPTKVILMHRVKIPRGLYILSITK